MEAYDIVVMPLSEEDGGGYAAFVPDLPGCMSDGESRAEAVINAEDAIREWLATQKERGLPIPKRGDRARKDLEEKQQMTAQMREALKKLEAQEKLALNENFGASFTHPIDMTLAHIH